MSGLRVRRAAALLLAAAVLAGCSGPGGTDRDEPSAAPEPGGSAEPTPGGGRDPAAAPETVCDIVSAELAAGLLDVGQDRLTGDCTANPEAGVHAWRLWTVRDQDQDQDQEQEQEPVEAALSVFVTDAGSPAGSGESFDTYRARAAENQRCELGLAAGIRPCYFTDDSFVVLLGTSPQQEQVLVSSLGATARIDPAEPGYEVSGDALRELSEQVADRLAAGGTVPDAEPVRTTEDSPLAGPGAAPDDRPAAGTVDKCLLYYDGPADCTSDNPEIEVGFVSLSSTEGCSFDIGFDFGDGTTARHRASGGPPGRTRLQDHTYRETGTYRVSATVKVLDGGCSGFDAGYTFRHQAAATPATCAYKLDEDRGRAYLFSMLPVGELKRPDGGPAGGFPHDDTDDGNNVFVDEAGVRWHLFAPGLSVYHQPAGWTEEATPGSAPFLKFVTDRDSTGGSFEAVLMPDGVVAGASWDQIQGRTFTYSDNWLTYGQGMPTYNLIDADRTSYLSLPSIGHYFKDVLPHDANLSGPDAKDDRYVRPTRFLDPRTDDWRTFRERFLRVRELIEDDGYRFPDDGSDVLHAPDGGDTHAVAADLAALAREITACADGE